MCTLPRDLPVLFSGSGWFSYSKNVTVHVHAIELTQRYILVVVTCRNACIFQLWLSPGNMASNSARIVLLLGWILFLNNVTMHVHAISTSMLDFRRYYLQEGVHFPGVAVSREHGLESRPCANDDHLGQLCLWKRHGKLCKWGYVYRYILMYML